MYCELVEKSIYNRNNFIPYSELKIGSVNYERYYSLYPFEQSIVEYVRLNQTLKGFKGKHYCPSICFDIDCENDLSSAKEETINLIKKLNAEYDINPNELFIYFSGNKGFHIMLVQNLFKVLEPEPNIAQRIKLFVEKLTSDFKFIDYKIYDNSRLIRMPNSLNLKSRLYKIEISYNELENLTIDQIKELSMNPRENFKRELPRNQIKFNEKFSQALHNIKTELSYSDIEITEGFFKSPEKGERNGTLHKQAVALFIYSELSKIAIFEIICNINQGIKEPLPVGEIKQIIKSAEAFAKTNKIHKETLIVKPFGEWLPDWIDSLRIEENKLNLCFPGFDNEMKGKLRGKLCSIVGYGGVKKSLFAQNTVMLNIVKSNAICLYSTMESGVPDLLDRMISFLGTDQDQNWSEGLRQIYYDDPKTFNVIIDKDIKPKYSTNLQISQNSSMTCKDYDWMINKISNEYGRVDILVVDGLSMMGGADKAVDRASDNTRELKELAKKHNMFIILIVHAARGLEKFTKDVSKNARDSEKIMDNSDFHISFSQILDSTKGSKDDKIFCEYLGHARLVNKRGSGKTIDVDFMMNPNNLRLRETELKQDKDDFEF
jgi:hypothetical protein